ncbi:NlpC/P60 family N-terminal domain-containing protein [uncultured Desulfovibrio sp.]|uniref:NlpC/P60 family N-terminal domain-containing protein n=1 Tax=uncultured Desulfovibrio sp. TaxID=167968 RepID=UPI00272C09C7|nr:NlpC/P60 family N-terminal domain-containing protein [uncultured Desulfovibrio sp.]
MKSCIRLLLSVFCLLLFTACSGKQIPTRDGDLPPWMGTVADMRHFPQDLNFYANAVGPDKPLLDAWEQAAQDARFNRIFFGPWEMGKTSMRKRDVAAIFRKARGFKHGTVRWSQREWDAMSRNAHLSAFPSRAQAAISVRNTDLREMPTHEARFSEPTPDPRANPFDYFQYSLLPPGTPVLVAHTSLDGRWHFVECPVAGGWVDAEDVALVDENFRAVWRGSRYAAVLRDKVVLPGTGRNGGDGQANIGTILPLAGENPDGSLRVLTPVKGTDGMAHSAEIILRGGDAAPKPLPLTAGNVARVGNMMMGQRYGWGGMFGDRDCSALTRELFTPFGLWLPRNSGAQARAGVTQSLEGLGAKEKEALILTNGVPFLSLVGMRGHITLYVGKYKGRAALFHNVWGVRVIENGDNDARFILGRAVVTSITPGVELKNLYRPMTFVDRLRTLSTPAVSRP